MTQPIKPMTTKEFADATGISTATISKNIRSGKIKAKKKGKAWMIPASQLESKVIQELKDASTADKSRKPLKAAAAIQVAKAPDAEVDEPKLTEPAPAAAAVATAEVAPPVRSEPTVPEKSYSVAEFAAMTYLTEKGVSEWLRIGRLCGHKTETGEWQVWESNLSAPGVSHLVRR
jgi:excisionase family DNA binding protein